ncbi:hypothetical protein AAFC00_003250 [Neodothiora populina]
MHFVHRRSNSATAIPLLFIHSFGATFIEVARMIESLCDPVTTPTPGRTSEQAFHVVSPSIPGFGFSDAAGDANFGIEGAADVLDALMQKLGYSRYMVHGSNWGFLVARSIALRHQRSCIAIHTAGLVVPKPTLRHTPLLWLRYQIARLTEAKYPWLSFGYTPEDFSTSHDDDNANHRASPPWWTPHAQYTSSSSIEHLATETSTLAYALADSPTGLLAFIIDLIRPQSTPLPTLTNPPLP